MKLSMTLYINHTLEAVEFYQKAFGLTLGYHEKFPDGTYLHAELQRDGKTIFAVCDTKSGEVADALHELAEKGQFPISNMGLDFDTEDEVERAYNMLKEEGVVRRPLGPLPWNPYNADVVDKYGVYWYLHIKSR